MVSPFLWKGGGGGLRPEGVYIKESKSVTKNVDTDNVKC